MRPDAGSDNGPAPRKRKERTKDGRLRKRTAIFVFSAVGSGNGFSERAGRTVDACRSGVRGRDGAVRRRCVRIAGRGRVLRTGTKGGLYAGGTFPGVGSVRAVVTGRADGQRAGIAKEGRSASRRPERSVAGKSVAGNLPCEARNRTGENEVGDRTAVSVRGLLLPMPFTAVLPFRDFRPEDRISAFFRRYSVVSRGNPDTARPFAGARFVVAAWRRRRTPAAGSGEHVFGA